MSIYTTRHNGEWVHCGRFPKLACCDCGLVHQFEFDNKDGLFSYRVWRDERATANMRRGKACKAGIKLLYEITKERKTNGHKRKRAHQNVLPRKARSR